jgi:glycerol kinase
LRRAERTPRTKNGKRFNLHLMTYLLALDQGTSSSRSIVFDAKGQIVALAQRELTQIYPQPGWVEHDPMEIWRTQIATAQEVLKKAGIGAKDVRALGITNQRETTVIWNRKTGQPIHNAIVWQDRRAEPLCAALRESGHEPLIQSKTGLLIDAYFSGTKLKWLLDHVSGARAQAERGELAFGNIDSWLMWQLTGGALHATDVSNASRTMLFNVRSNTWDAELLALLDVPESMMPKVLPSSAHFGNVLSDLLGHPLQIGGVAGDQQSALFGQACFKSGRVKNTYGTGCFMLMHTGTQFQTSGNGLLTTSAAQVERPPRSFALRNSLPPGGAAAPADWQSQIRGPGWVGTPSSDLPASPDFPLSAAAGLGTPEYALEGSVFVGGAVVQWLRDGLKAISGSGQVQALAESVPDSGGVMLVPAFTGLGAPYWKPDARGTMTGLTRGTTLAHIARAALESIAYQSAALLQAMSRDAVAAGAAPVAELRVDGGASINDLLMQFQADLLGIPVVRPAVTETTALGAAYLAGLSSGVFADRDEIASLWRAEKRFEPSGNAAHAAELMARWEHAVRQTVAS